MHEPDGLQACEKLLLAEGTKIAMTKVQSAYDQGVYGLVVNLGSVAVRTLFQPFEEAAFMAFSRPLPGRGAPQQRLLVLFPLVKVALLFGGYPSVGPRVSEGCKQAILHVEILARRCPRLKARKSGQTLMESMFSQLLLLREGPQQHLQAHLQFRPGFRCKLVRKMTTKRPERSLLLQASGRMLTDSILGSASETAV